MDKRTIIIKLNKFFCDSNRQERKYVKAWLSKKQIWGTTYRYDLHVIAAGCICRSKEMRELSDKLSSKFNGELSDITRIEIHEEGSRPNNKFHDLLVFDCEEPCYTQKIY